MTSGGDRTEDKRLAWEKAKFFISAVGGAGLFFIGLWQFSITSRNDFAKPVFQKQLELCIDASNAAAILAQDPAQANARSDVGRTYLSLYYGRLAVVEDQCLYRTMVNFKRAVFDKDTSDVMPDRAALRIAFACRRMLTRGWSAGLLGIYDPQRLLESFTDLDDYRESIAAIPGCER